MYQYLPFSSYYFSIWQIVQVLFVRSFSKTTKLQQRMRMMIRRSYRRICHLHIYRGKWKGWRGEERFNRMEPNIRSLPLSLILVGLSK